MGAIRYILLAASLLLACDRDSAQLDDYSVLQNGFVNPPDEAKVKTYWWWLHGSADRVRIREELEAFRAAGISAVDIFDIGTPDHSDTRGIIEAGPAFMDDEYLANIAYAVEVAGELGMKIGLNLSSSWNAGGEWITPEHASKSLYYSKARVSGSANSQEIEIPFPLLREEDDAGRNIIIEYEESGRPGYYREVAVVAVPVHDGVAYPDTSRIRNITEHLNSRTNLLNWNPPEGEWEIYRYIVANSGRQVVLPSEHSGGPILDHLDADAMGFHVNYFIDRLATVIDDIEASALTYLYLASYEARGFIWTTKLPETFKKMHGYDIFKFIPALHIQDAYVASAYPEDDVAKRFIYDFNKTVSDMMVQNHYQKGSEVAHTVGLKLISESGGPGLPLHNTPVDALGALGALDIPRGEFWYEHSRWTEEDVRFAIGDSLDLLRMVKGPAAAANIYKKDQVEMEAFTSWHHWQTGPFDIKPVGDRAFAEGMNRVTVHGASHNPTGTGYPGIAYHAGTHYNDKLAWWPKIRPFNDYLGRISHMLQEGSFYSDVIYYQGDQAPNIVRVKNQDFSVGPGYDYEVINTDILLRELSVDDGFLELPDVGRYRVLVLDPSDQIHPEVLEKLGDLADQGAVILGDKPDSKTGLGYHDWDGGRLQRAISQSWRSVTAQSATREDLSGGNILEGLTALEALEIFQVKPDIAYPGQLLNGPLDYIHYNKGATDFYFVRNTTGEWLTKRVRFRQRNKVPELWDPVTGKQHRLPVYHKLESQTEIPLTFKPYDAYFIVFREGDEEPVWETMVNSRGDVPAYDRTGGGYVFRNADTVRFKKNEHTLEISSAFQSFPIEGDWQVDFPENRGAPSQAVFPDLQSWTQSEKDGIKYFSGVATYQKTFSLPVDPDTLSDDYRIYLNLGSLEKVADAWINGEALGISWAKPHEYDVTGHVKRGDNDLTLEIANVWANRVIGDAKTGQNFTTTNITNVRGTPWVDVPLVSSGLLGPVHIELRRRYRPATSGVQE
ncbi:MAG: glycosyl hydrolase [Balneolales bacterium]